MWTLRRNSADVTDRKCTNISSLFFCIGFVVLMLILVGYSAINANLERLTKGYDDCGNICGAKNPDTSFDTCGVHDKTNAPKTQVDNNVVPTKNGTVYVPHYTCVSSCANNYFEVFNRCFKMDTSNKSQEININEGLQSVAQDLIITWPLIVAVCFVAFVFSYILLILFRYAIKYVIWIIYIGFIVCVAGGAIALWYMWGTTKEPEVKPAFLIGAIMLSLMAVTSIIVLWWFRKRIRLVAQLFKEASKALTDVPSIIFEPILTFVALIFAIALFIFFAVLIETSGRLQADVAFDGKPQAQYVKDFGMVLAHITNLIAFIWFAQFIFGCQHFVIAGTISKWYFTRDKTKLNAPVTTSFSNLVRFHLGSVCLGSMILTLVKIIKMIVEGIKNQARESGNVVAQALACCCSWIIDSIDEFLQYLFRNAYIIVAKDGTPFFESGKRAFGLLFRNLMDVIALNNFGDIVLNLARIFVVVICGFIGYELMHKPEVSSVFAPLLLAVIFSFFIVHCFITVFEMTVDTIFMCFCIDCEENNGTSEPYYMSPALMKVMQELKETAGGQFNFGQMQSSEAGNTPMMPHQNPAYPPVTQQPHYYPPLPQQNY